jgi:chorismate mutase
MSSAHAPIWHKACAYSSDNTANPKGATSMSRNQQKVIRTTLGDLIAAVTDEAKPFARDPSSLYMMVSHILNDLLARHRLRAHKAVTTEIWS